LAKHKICQVKYDKLLEMLIRILVKGERWAKAQLRKGKI